MPASRTLLTLLLLCALPQAPTVLAAVLPARRPVSAARAVMSPLAAPTRQQPASPSPTPAAAEPPAPLLEYIRGWWVVGITVASALPWAVVAVLDAIDMSYRTADIIKGRLLLSTTCLLLAYTSGLLFIIVLMINILNGIEEGRYDEVATVLVLLIFNLWHVLRNVRGWLQYWALHKLRPIFLVLQRNLASSAPKEPDEEDEAVCLQGLERLRISNRLIDNDWNRDTPFLNPFYKLRGFGRVNVSATAASDKVAGKLGDGKMDEGSRFGRRKRVNSSLLHSSGVPDAIEETWAVAAWRAWWTQDTSLLPWQMKDLTAPETFKCDLDHRHTNVDGLTLGRGPSWPSTRNVIDSDSPSKPIITTKEQWAKCLLTYGWPKDEEPEGQQDTHGDVMPRVATFSDASGVATVVREKTRYPPNRMSALWYNTARFEELYEAKSQEVRKMPEQRRMLMPQWSSWLRIAQDIGTHLSRPVYLSDTHLVNFAGELASASLIIALYPAKYRELVEQIYEDGLDARWTFGWSGLLACFSHLWTKERIHIAMLNGLSLLALASSQKVENLNENVRSMLYGYASFAVSDRAVGKRIAEDRKAELLRRYKLDKGKTCRGSGVCATRMACQTLGLPAEASHMDGLPAFATGWASEYMERKPGNQSPEHGDSHDDVEKKHGSSNVWRYPHSHT